MEEQGERVLGLLAGLAGKSVKPDTALPAFTALMCVLKQEEGRTLCLGLFWWGERERGEREPGE